MFEMVWLLTYFDVVVLAERRPDWAVGELLLNMFKLKIWSANLLFVNWQNFLKEEIIQKVNLDKYYYYTCLFSSVTNLPDITENEVDDHPDDSNDLELNVRRNLEVESGGEVLGTVESHEDDSGAGRHSPGSHDHWKKKLMF